MPTARSSSVAWLSHDEKEAIQEYVSEKKDGCWNMEGMSYGPTGFFVLAGKVLKTSPDMSKVVVEGPYGKPCAVLVPPETKAPEVFHLIGAEVSADIRGEIYRGFLMADYVEYYYSEEKPKEEDKDGEEKKDEE